MRHYSTRSAFRRGRRSVYSDIRAPPQRAERPMAASAEKLSMFHYHTEQQCWATVTTRR